MRPAAIVLALAASLALAACGGGRAYSSKASTIGPLTNDSNGVWIFRPKGKPKGLVVFFHGQGGPREATPVNHVPWIAHFVEEGNIVVYPRYEVTYEAAAIAHIVAGVRKAAERVDVSGLPVLAVGYSRGGALALEYASVAAGQRLPVPNAILSVFPAPQGDETKLYDLGLDPKTRILFLYGQADAVVGTDGVIGLVHRLKVAHFPAGQIYLRQVRSRGAFSATHDSPIFTSAAAKAAFWRPADRLLAQIEG